MADSIALVEDLFERIEGLLDRIESRRPEVDTDSIRLLERRICQGLELTERALRDSSGGANEVHEAGLRSLRRQHRAWIGLLRSLQALAPGSPRWWTRLEDLGARIRWRFQEFEYDVLGYARGDPPQSA